MSKHFIIAAAAAMFAGVAHAQAPVSAGMSLPGYSQVFFHDFPGTSLDTGVWPVQYGGTSSNGFFQWSRDDLEVNNGLTIHFRQQGSQWTTGGIDMKPNGTVGGLFEFYARTDQKHGVGPVLLLWPCNNQWPPEIDVLEAPNGNSEAFQTLHWGRPDQNFQNAATTAVDVGKWHNYAVLWEADRIVYYIDNSPTATIPASGGNVPQQCMAIGLSGYIADPHDNWYGGPPTDASESVMQVAWVRISKKAGEQPWGAVASSGGAPNAKQSAVCMTSTQQTAAAIAATVPPPGMPIDPTKLELASATRELQADLQTAQAAGHQTTMADLAAARAAVAAAPLAPPPNALQGTSIPVQGGAIPCQ